MNCRKCGKQTNEADRFCAHCGTETGKSATSFAAYEETIERIQIKNTPGKWIQLLIVCGLIFLVCFVGCSPAENNSDSLPNNRIEIPLSAEDKVRNLASDFAYNIFMQSYSGCSFDTPEVCIEYVTMNDLDSEVIVSVEAGTSMFKYRESYLCYFELVENEWQSNYWNFYGSELTVLSSPITQEMADMELAQILPQNATYTLREHSLETHTGIDSFVYDVVIEDGYKLNEYVYSVIYSFDLYNGWDNVSCDSYQTNSVWNIEGTWTYNSSSSNATIIIHKVDGDIFKVEYNYDLFYETPHWNDYEKTAGESTRVEEVELKSSGSSLYFHLGEETFYLDQYAGIHVVNKAIIFSHDSGHGYDIPSKYAMPYSYSLIDSFAISYTSTPLKISLGSDYAGDVRITSGFGHAGGEASRSTQTYDLYENYRTFYGEFYLSNGATIGTDAVARIYGDGNLLYEFNANALTENNYEHRFVIDVTGIRELTIDMPGNSVRSGYFTQPALYLENVIVTKGVAYDAVSLRIPGTTAHDDPPLRMECFSFSERTGFQPIFVTIGYNESYFRLNENYDYVLNEETVLVCAKEIYSEYAKNNTNHFIVLYFDDGISDFNDSKSECFYVYAPSELSTIYNSLDVFYSIIDSVYKGDVSYLSRIGEALPEYADYLYHNK